MSEENIFSQGQTTVPNQQQQQTPPSNDFADLLGSIKNERGEPKYRDVNTALDALRHSQEYIPQLKSDMDRVAQENQRLLAEIERLKTVEQTVAQLTSQQQQQNQPVQQPVLKEEEIANLVVKTLSQREQEQKRSQNINTVTSKLKEVFGDKAEETFYSKAQELGLSPQQVNNLAAESPSAVFKMFGVEGGNKPQASFKPTTSSINTAGYTQPSQSFIGRNTSAVMLGATTHDLIAEKDRSKQMVEELHKNGASIHDLTDPKVYFKFFK